MDYEQVAKIPCIYRISVKALIKDDKGRILLIQEAEHGWELPGGGLDHGEAPPEALARELREEIKVQVESIDDKPIGFWTIHGDVGPRWFGFVLYEVRIKGRPSAGEEAEEWRYFDDKEIVKLKLHPNTRPYFTNQR